MTPESCIRGNPCNCPLSEDPHVLTFSHIAQFCPIAEAIAVLVELSDNILNKSYYQTRLRNYSTVSLNVNIDCYWSETSLYDILNMV